MSRKLWILIFLVCSAGLIVCAHGAGSEEKNGTEMSSSNSSGDSGGGSIVNAIMSDISKFTDKLMDMIKDIVDGAKSLVMEILEMIFMSDDKSMTTTRRRRSVDSSEGSLPGNTSIMGMISNVFLAPFKMAFGLVKDLSPSSIIHGLENVLSPIEDVIHTAPVQAFTNTTKKLFDSATSELWNFTKSNVLPELNKAVTTLRKSDALPSTLNNYLGDLQDLYMICRTLGIV
ncbi:hypothetical protein TSAR_011777 [Trichomalopsis sarcophagae]|uniref:Uncharacterized protein n=1 Tax=Trichomalopsis sarcophagae TaxID=543379 RepID=A0A232F890_9HYME|nr:hypothetical protein TSAR_011777 [Trichomalopsis sarcophagae]